MEFEIKLENGKSKRVNIGPYSTFNAILSSDLTKNIRLGYNYDNLVSSLSYQLHYDPASLKATLDMASGLDLVGIYVNTPETQNWRTGNDKTFVSLDLSNSSSINAKLNRVHLCIGA